MKNVKKTSDYGNESISSLKGADRVRRRPGVILAPTVLRAASTQYLKSSPILLTRLKKDSAAS